MFWKRKNNNADKSSVKLPGPREISEPVKKSLIASNRIDPDIIPFLKLLVKPDENQRGKYFARIFDPADAEARGVRVKDYLTLDDNPEMIIAEGTGDDSSKTAAMEVKISIPKPSLLTYEEILASIVSLKEPEQTIFFYMAAGAGSGGPLGRGAAVIKLNDTTKGKVKKYSVFGCHVVNMKPIANQLKMFDTNKAEEIARWVAAAQKPRFC